MKGPPPDSASKETSATDTELSLAHNETAEVDVGAPGHSGEAKQKSEESEAVTSGDEELGVEYLSCAGVQLEITVWSTMQKAAALKGNFMSVCIRVNQIPVFSGSDHCKGGTLVTSKHEYTEKEL